MNDRKKYFVTVDTGEIRETSVPDGIEYEVLATLNEIKVIDNLFVKMDKSSKDAMKSLVKPFNEKAVDDKRQNYDDHLITVYQHIYELGTEETKSKINQLELLS